MRPGPRSGSGSCRSGASSGSRPPARAPRWAPPSRTSPTLAGEDRGLADGGLPGGGLRARQREVLRPHRPRRARAPGLLRVPLLHHPGQGRHVPGLRALRQARAGLQPPLRHQQRRLPGLLLL
eukprot:8009964-Alexandrium_andersonii.AAC.1